MPRFVLLVGFFLAASAFAPAAERTHDVVPADYFTLATITDIALSPDGSKVAYTEARWDEADGLRKSNLWLVATDGKSPPRRLTGDRANDRSPHWSADGKAVYVLANRKRAGESKPPYDGSTQVWRVPLTGEPLPITRVDSGVSGYDYAPEAEAIFYNVNTTDRDKDDFADLRKKFTNPDYGSGVRTVSEIHRIDLARWRTETLVDEQRYVREFAVTSDGNRLAMITAIDDTVVQSEGHSRVDVWDATSGQVVTTDQSWRKAAASPWPWLGSLAWNPAGTAVAYCTVFDAHPAEIVVQVDSDGAWEAVQLPRMPRTQVHGYGSPLLWSSTRDSVYYVADIAGSHDIMTRDLKERGYGGGNVFAKDGAVIHAHDMVPVGNGRHRMVAVRSTPDRFPELVTYDYPKGVHVLANPNAHTADWKLPEVKHITWTAPDGTSVGGVLELPPGYTKADGKLPLLVAMHGGPTTASRTELSFDPHNGRLYTSTAGYAVLCPNYRGSTGYGDKFVTDLIGNENDIEVRDILAGIGHLIEEGIVDQNRVGVMGWSNGGYLTNCLITLKDSPIKFRAASSGAGILDTVAEWGFNDEPAYPMVFKKGAPWETPDIYRKTSPTYGLGNVTTPTLIHVGGNDVRCPPGHSRMLHRALKHYVKVPTELVVYPGEPHGLTKMANRRAKMEWDLAWFDKFLKNAK